MRPNFNNNRPSFNNRAPQAPPVSQGDEVDVHIEAMGEKGDGIAKKQGFVIFVPGAKIGDYVKIRITKVLAKVCFAEVLQKMEVPADQKIVPPPQKDKVQIQPSEDFGEEPSEDGDDQEIELDFDEEDEK